MDDVIREVLARDGRIAFALVFGSAVQAAKIAAIADAVRRVREVLPSSPAGLETDRTARELITLNLFVAVQECISLATHWLADEGRAVPGTFAVARRRMLEAEISAPAILGSTAFVQQIGDLLATNLAP